MVAMDENNRLVALCRDGDHDALEALIRTHQRMIHSLCYRMTGSLPDAEDLAQETFIHAYQHLASFRAEARFSSWLYRIAVNQCLNWRKRSARQERLVKDWSARDAGAPGGGDDRAEQVQYALLRLSSKARAAIVLTVYDGLTHAQAAQVLGCSETTVSWRLFAARRRLKALLKGLQEPGAFR